MLDSFEEKSSTGNIQDYLAMVKRRRWWFMLPFFFGWLLTWGVSKFVPLNYESSAVILVSRQTVPDGFVATNVSIDFPERLQSLTQQIMSKEKLLVIAQGQQLYPNQNQMTPDRLVERMRRDIVVTPVPIDDLATTSSPEDVSIATKRALNQPNGKLPDAMAFRISFLARKPLVAQQVEVRLAQLFIEGNHQERTQSSQQTTTFLEAQLKDQAQGLDEQETRIQEFKSRYLNELPESKDGNIQLLSVLQGRLQSANDSLNKAQQQKLYLETQAAQYQPLEEALSEGKDVSTTSLIAAIDKDLGQLRSQLTDLKGSYTERYPDVRRVEEQISEDEGQKVKLEAQRTATEAQKNPSAGPATIRLTSLAELQQMSPILQIQSQAASNKKEIEDLQSETKDLQTRISQIQDLLSRMPLREQQLAELTRDYDQSKTIYQGLLAKAGESEMATDLETSGQSGQFVILNPPNEPSHPAQPNWFTFSLIGLGVGAALGLAIAAVSELSDDRLYDAKVLKGMIPAATLTRIPPIGVKSSGFTPMLEGLLASVMIFVMAVGTLLAFYA
jgi:polysaccharide biosynthesis transport protein